MANNLNLSITANSRIPKIIVHHFSLTYPVLECLKRIIYIRSQQPKYRGCLRGSKFSFYCKKRNKRPIGIWKRIQIFRKVSYDNNYIP